MLSLSFNRVDLCLFTHYSIVGVLTLEYDVEPNAAFFATFLQHANNITLHKYLSHPLQDIRVTQRLERCAAQSSNSVNHKDNGDWQSRHHLLLGRSYICPPSIVSQLFTI